MEYNYIVAFGFGQVYSIAFDQVRQLNNAEFFNNELSIGMVEHLINQIGFTPKIKSVFQKPFVHISFNIRFHRFKKILKNMPNENTPCIIMSSTYRQWEERMFFSYLRKKIPNIKLVYFLTDIVESSSQIRSIVEKECSADLIISYDKKNADQYDVKYYPVPYSDISSKYDVNAEEFDICFIGARKNRLSQLRRVYDYLVDKGISCDFYITGVEKSEQESASGIHYCDAVSYDEYLKVIAKSKCILEIIQDNCVGNTFRVSEAIFLRKKLITNNTGIISTKCYFPDNMLVFNTPDDINPDFISSCVQDYPDSIKEYLLPKTFLDFVGANIDTKGES